MDSHVPVMPDVVVAQLKLTADPDEVVVDATVGCGGTARALWKAMKGRGTLIGIDRDPEMIEIAKRRFREEGVESESIRWVEGSFGDLTEHLARLGIRKFDRIVFDFGLNSVQLDDPERGFSFGATGPLDARFNRDEATPTMADALADLDPKRLEKALRDFGDERFARRIARAIEWHRERKSIETTEELARIVRSAIKGPRGKRRIDSATRTFQALRILINDELGHIQRGLEQAIEGLSVNGRIICLSYHSGEDRLVKLAFREHDVRFQKGDETQAMREKALLKVLTRKPLRPSDEECRRNRRARSARLRTAEKVLPVPGN